MKVPLESVGKHLNEHPSILLSPFYVNDSSLFPRIHPDDTEKLIEDYRQGKGLLTLLTEGPQCFKASSRAESGWSNLWITMASQIRTAQVPQVVRFFVVNGRPKSRGSVTLDTELYKAGIKDDVQLALIDLALLTESDDVEDMLEGNFRSPLWKFIPYNSSFLFSAIKLVFQIVEDTKAFQSLNMTYGAEHEPACLQFEFRSDEYWKCVLFENVTPWIHLCGTCGMGRDESDSVLDSKLRYLINTSNHKII